MSHQEARTAADSHDVIRVRGARENNLANVSLDIPKRRLINETCTAFIQSFMPNLARPTWTPCTA